MKYTPDLQTSGTEQHKNEETNIQTCVMRIMTIVETHEIVLKYADILMETGMFGIR